MPFCGVETDLAGFDAGLLDRCVVSVVYCPTGKPGRDGIVRQLLNLPASSTCDRLKGAVQAIFQDHRLHRLLLSESLCGGSTWSGRVNGPTD